MKKTLIALALLAGCGEAEDGQRSAATGNGAAAANAAAPAAKGGVVPAAGLTGLYEGGDVDPRNQLCIIDKGEAGAQFGLVVWGANMHSCSGSGTAVRDGGSLRLSMAGDEACAIEATIEGGTVTFPAGVPDGCAYYCGAQAKLGGVTLQMRGNRAEDALEAKDLVGEPLCSR